MYTQLHTQAFAHSTTKPLLRYKTTYHKNTTITLIYMNLMILSFLFHPIYIVTSKGYIITTPWSKYHGLPKTNNLAQNPLQNHTIRKRKGFDPPRSPYTTQYSNVSTSWSTSCFASLLCALLHALMCSLLYKM